MTATREALVEELVTSLHLNVPERRMLGSDSVSVEEVAAVVKGLLERNGVFPLNAKPWQPGEIVFEGFFPVKIPDGRVQVAWQRTNPIRPTELADQGGSDYDNLDEAISTFINREWSTGMTVSVCRIGPDHESNGGVTTTTPGWTMEWERSNCTQSPKNKIIKTQVAKCSHGR